jgi:putative protease
MGRRVYVTVNTVFEQREADRMYQLLKYLAALGPDGIIVQDFGVLRMVREYFPSLKIHASTQMNIASARAVNLLSKQGVSRVVLARELSMAEIREIRAGTNAELEVFVHGALCVSASGLCLFSGFLGGKSANRGMCTQACRRLYFPSYRDSTSSGSGGYYFSPADLELLGDIPALADAGVNSFKIEGRMKSAEYVGVVVAAYRRVIDNREGDREAAVREGFSLLRNDYARKKTRFYFPSGASSSGIDWLNPGQDGGTGIPLGTIRKVRGSGDSRRALIAGAAAVPETGDSVRFHRSDDSDRKSHKLISVEEAGPEEGPGARWLSLPEGFKPGDSVYLIRTRGMSKRYPPVVPRAPEGFNRSPGWEQAPAFPLPPVKKRDPRLFPEGLYVAVSRPEDLFIVQSIRPVRVMLRYNPLTTAGLPGESKQFLPFSPGEIIILLDPYFPQATDGILGEAITRLRKLGYSQFVINNPGQLSYFREAFSGTGHGELSLIAGPYLYAFNRWAVAFISSLGMDSFISPPENNRQNLERTVEPERRVLTFITVFSYPVLFRIRADIRGIYHFEEFQDRRGERFRLIGASGGDAGRPGDAGAGNSLVIPEQPFSIVDKIPFLREAGFGRFILDFSGPPLKKKDYKDVMTALQAGTPLPHTGRFNWKDGFFQEAEKQ